MADERAVIELDIDASGSVSGGRRVSVELDRIGRQADGVGGRFRGAFGSLRGLLLGVVAPLISIAGAVRLVSRAVQEAGMAALIERRLERALRNLGEVSPQAVEGLKRIAAQLQATTNFTDDAVLTAAQLLATFRSVGGSEGIGMLLPRLADMAAGVARATGETMDLNQVAQLVGKAMEGQVTALRRVGVSLSEAEAEAIKMATGLDRVRLVAEVLDRNFQGLAEAGADPFVIMKNAAEELYEVLGEQLYVVLADVAKQLADIAANEGFLAFVRQAGQLLADGAREALSLAQELRGTASAMLEVGRAASGIANSLGGDAGLGLRWFIQQINAELERLGRALRFAESLMDRFANTGRTLFGGGPAPVRESDDVTAFRNFIGGGGQFGPPGRTVTGRRRIGGGGVPGVGGGGGGGAASTAAADRAAEAAAQRKAAELMEEARLLEDLLKLWSQLLQARAGVDPKGGVTAIAGPTPLTGIKADARDLIDVTLPELEQNIVDSTVRITDRLAQLASVYGDSVAGSLATLSDAFLTFFEASGRQNKAALIAFKAAAIAETIIATYAAATHMLNPRNSGPAPINYIAAAAVVAAGLANLARIRSVSVDGGGGAGGGGGVSGGGSSNASAVAGYAGGFGSQQGNGQANPTINNTVNPTPVEVRILAGPEGLYAVVENGGRIVNRTRGSDRA